MKRAMWFAWGLRALLAWGGLEAGLWGADALGARMETWRELRSITDRSEKLWMRYRDLVRRHEPAPTLPARPTDTEIGAAFASTGAQLAGLTTIVDSERQDVTKLKLVMTWSDTRASLLAPLSQLAAQWPGARINRMALRAEGDKITGEIEAELLIQAPRDPSADSQRKSSPPRGRLSRRENRGAP